MILHKSVDSSAKIISNIRCTMEHQIQSTPAFSVFFMHFFILEFNYQSRSRRVDSSRVSEWKYAQWRNHKVHVGLDANTPPPAANPRSEQNTNTGSFELWALADWPAAFVIK